VVTGAATLLREGLPVRFFGVCAKAVPKDCAVLGTITDPNWKPDGVYLLMDPAKVTVHCQYAQDADRNGCNDGGAYTAGQQRPLCTEDAANPECQYGADETEAMLAAYTAYCTDDAENCLENQLEAQWNIDSVIAIGYMNRGDQAWDCEDSQTKAEHFAEAVNTTWSTDVPIVQLFIDVANNQLRFGVAATGCQPPQDHTSPGRGRTTCGLASGTGSAALPRGSLTATHRSLPAMPVEHPRASAESPYPKAVTPTRTPDEVLAIAGPLLRWRDSRCSALAAMRARRPSRARDARRL
jgi:hypothetical protein